MSYIVRMMILVLCELGNICLLVGGEHLKTVAVGLAQFSER